MRYERIQANRPSPFLTKPNGIVCSWEMPDRISPCLKLRGRHQNHRSIRLRKPADASKPVGRGFPLANLLCLGTDEPERVLLLDDLLPGQPVHQLIRHGSVAQRHLDETPFLEIQRLG